MCIANLLDSFHNAGKAVSNVDELYIFTFAISNAKDVKSTDV